MQARIFLRIMLLVLLAATPGQAFAKRIALVVANARYASANALKNPPADARIIATALKQAGFDTVTVRNDLGKAALETELQGFSRLAEGAEVALIYYAGHGIEAGGQNYLIPTDAKLVRDRDLEIEATRLDTLLLMGEGAKLRIVVLDACRNNPFAASMQRTLRNRAVGRGLAAVEPEGETLVVFAAKAGATAADGEGANSPFAQAMARRLPERGLEISLLFRAIRDDVLAQTGREQEPFTYGSLSGQAFYFVPPGAQQAGTAPRPQPQQTPANDNTESLFWQGALAANTDVAFSEYLKRYPKGTFSTLAQQNLRKFSTQPTPQAPKPATTQASPLGIPGIGTSGVPNLGAAFSAPTGQTSAGVGATAASRFAFRPNATARQQTTRNFIAQMRSSNAQMGAILELALNQRDMFQLVNTEVGKLGLTTNNLADSLTIFIDTLRDSANGRSSTPTAKQARAVRDQMALVLLATPSTMNMTPAQMQEFSDTFMLTAITFQLLFEAAKSSSPSDLQSFSNLAQEIGKSNLGIDLRSIRMTDDGYRM